MLAVAVVLWLDALLGGARAGGASAVAVVALLAFLAGLGARRTLLVVTAPPVVALLTVANQIGSPGEFGFADDAVFYAVVVGAPALTGALLSARGAALRQLEARRAELLRRRATVVRAARAAEVERVEREVDDALTDRLRGIIDGVAEASSRSASRPEAVPVTLASVEADARAALALMRDVLGVLRPSQSPTTDPLPTESAADAPAPPASRQRTMDRVDVLLVLAVIPLVVETSLPGHRGPAWLNVVLALAQGLLLPVVRRRPIAGVTLLLAVACVHSAVLTPLPPAVSWSVPGLLASFLVGHAPARRTAWVGMVVMLGGTSLVTVVTPAPDRALDGFVPASMAGVLAWLGGRALAAREARAAELRAIGDELDRTRDRAARLAAIEQRAELARELHDVGAHALTVVCLQSGAAQTWWDRDRQQALVALAALDDLAGNVLTSLSVSLSGLATTGPGPPLEVLADVGRVLGLTVGVRVDGQPRPITNEVSQVVFRVVQEALTNAARHARRGRVEVGLVYGADSLDVEVSDGGPHHDGEPVVAVPGSGLGLSGMAERVEAVRGELSYGPIHGGYRVHARLPLVLQP